MSSLIGETLISGANIMKNHPAARLVLFFGRGPSPSGW